MQSGFDLRIRMMINALAETVLPAIDSTNRAAIEQAHIVIGSLELLRQQVDYAHWFEVADARGMAALIRAIVAAAALPSANAAAAVAAADDALAVAAAPMSGSRWCAMPIAGCAMRSAG